MIIVFGQPAERWRLARTKQGFTASRYNEDRAEWCSASAHGSPSDGSPSPIVISLSIVQRFALLTMTPTKCIKIILAIAFMACSVRAGGMPYLIRAIDAYRLRQRLGFAKPRIG